MSAKSKDLGWWAVRQTSRKRPGDELTVYLLSKIFDRHSLIYTLKEPWCTFVHKIDDALSTLLSKSDLVFIYTTYGFGQIIDLPPALRTKKQRTTKKRKSTAQDNETQQKRCNTNDTKGSAMTHVKPAAKRSNKTPHNRKQYNRSQQMETDVVNASTSDYTPPARKRIPIHVNNVSAALSTSHIIESDRIHNTRKPKSRKRTNPRSARETSKVDYTVFYNSGETTTESSPSPKRSRTVAEISLREPTESRLNAQRMITRRRLQEMSPTGCRVKLLGTATSPQPILPKPKIKLEKIKREPIVKTEKQLEIEDYLAKGLCLSAHTDGSACANIQNPNNVNVPPMSIREHRRKQRADKALFLAGLIAKQTAANNARKCCNN